MWEESKALGLLIETLLSADHMPYFYILWIDNRSNVFQSVNIPSVKSCMCFAVFTLKY